MPHFVTLAAGDPAFSHCLQIRIAVFVQEQNVPIEHEHDALDATALHFLAYENAIPAATARVVLKDAGAIAKIGRVAVLPAARGKGLGVALMRAIEAAPELAGVWRFTLDAQIQAEKFYGSLGYVGAGAVFMEANIAHRMMSKPR